MYADYMVDIRGLFLYDEKTMQYQYNMENCDPSVQHLKPLSSLPKTLQFHPSQFHTKNPSVPPSLSSTPKPLCSTPFSVQHHKPLGSTPSVPHQNPSVPLTLQFHTKEQSVQHTPQFHTKNA